jgi:hypothetical protein
MEKYLQVTQNGTWIKFISQGASRSFFPSFSQDF